VSEGDGEKKNRKMKILVTGAKGQLGNELQLVAKDYVQHQFIFTNQEKVEAFFKNEMPDVTINCAAYTAVDNAEKDYDKAFRINAVAAGYLAGSVRHHEGLLIHISTDYVFDGTAHRPYTESDPVNPESSYAKSKFEGEKAVINSGSRAIIIRTSWLYSGFGNNFVKTILKYSRERESLRVVFDQVGSPTYARDLARSILTILPSLDDFKGAEIFNFSDEGVASWYDFALAIIEFAGVSCKIYPIETNDYPLPAKRPFYSVLNKAKFKERFQIEIPHWRESLKECIRILS
jgi:dTDP-4-dehydrorhamnose reductase